MTASPEITWSLMHPVKLDVNYMKRVVKKAEEYNVDSFEICGPCHGTDGGMDGLLLYEKYPQIAAALNTDEIIEQRKKLTEIIDIAHTSGKPVLYWHREIVVPPHLTECEPALLDENGEFNLLGNAFEELIKYKIEEFFKAVPALDGFVLTLTEADFSVIHNSSPEKYPPAQVVEKIVRIFAEELKNRKKRFILRSFGSIAEDYEAILAGAEPVAKDYDFEVETKITPYDFVPFLPLNPFLNKVSGATLAAECDSLGEFLGAGYLPSTNIDNIVRYVREGQAKDVDRYAIRIDRIGNCIFDTYEINLFAYHAAIEEPNISAEEIVTRWCDKHWNGIDEMKNLAMKGLDVVLKTHYIDGNVIFHMFPIKPDLKWIKAGGIMALLKNNVSLENHSGIWSILSDNNTPGREAVLKEKEEAVSLAKEGLTQLLSLESRLDKDEFKRNLRLWENAVIASSTVRAFVRCLCGYFDDMEAELADCPRLTNAQIEAKRTFAALPSVSESVSNTYVKPLEFICNELSNEYRGEFKLRQTWRTEPEITDFIICGGLLDDWRIARYMHGSHSRLEQGVPVREVGNRIFPNGFIDVELNTPVPGHYRLKLSANILAADSCSVSIGNSPAEKYSFEQDGTADIDLSDQPAGPIKIRIEKSGAAYPEIYAIGLKVI